MRPQKQTDIPGAGWWEGRSARNGDSLGEAKEVLVEKEDTKMVLMIKATIELQSG